MDIEQLIERLNMHLQSYASYSDSELAHTLEDAATALSTLQAENAQLRESQDHWKRLAHELSEGVNGKDAEHERLQAENEKLRAELERVKEERDAVVESIPHECKTCVYHTVFFNGCTLDHDCTNPDGGCSNNYDGWRWRGRKED